MHNISTKVSYHNNIVIKENTLFTVGLYMKKNTEYLASDMNN